jgi:predicted enzyme related to lactoylglutathione lyase
MGDAIGQFKYVVVDCAEPEQLAAFWCQVLGVEVAGRWNQYVMLTPTVDGGPRLNFQQVRESRAGKNRLHLDLHVRDVEAASGRVTALGGSVVDDVAQEHLRWRVMADPEGNEFCLVHDPTA